MTSPTMNRNPHRLRYGNEYAKQKLKTHAIGIVGVLLFVSGILFFSPGHRIINDYGIPVDTGPITLQSGNAEIDYAHNLALDEISGNIKEGRFIAGSGWAQLWTRDTSYAAEQAASVLYPQVVRASLEASVEHFTDRSGSNSTVWLQDYCAHFGGWPNLSDAIVGARGAWAVYRVEGNITFLEWAYSVTVNSLRRAEAEAFDETTGLFTGCSSFMESNSGYPLKYKHNGALVGKTKALSTNLLYYSGYDIAAKMGRELGMDSNRIESHERNAGSLRDAIRSLLWLEDKGYYSYFQDENGNLVENMEGLGESLALLELESDPQRVGSIFRRSKQTDLGVPCLWPRFDLGSYERADHASSFYHNGPIWPFVDAYWALAAAEHGEVEIFARALKGLTSLAVKGKTFAEFYELNGTFLEYRSKQLWSETAFLSMIYQGLFGMRFQVDCIEFKPVKPKSLFPQKSVSLKNFKYKGSLLDITIRGSGNNIVGFEVNGRRSGDRPFFSSRSNTGTRTGRYVINIQLQE